MEALEEVGRATGNNFGDAGKPLLVSVRSGARASMPGMMDTVLNLELNDETAAALARRSGDERFALDSYRRFIHCMPTSCWASTITSSRTSSRAQGCQRPRARHRSERRTIGAR